MAVRLGPDADAEGNELSRYVVPEGEEYAFMGEPGDIVWRAPRELYWGWLPVWAGIGHGELPEGLTDLRLELVDDGGPGKLEVYTSAGLEGKPQRKLSSVDEAHRSYTPGSHGRYSWIFTEPGIYHTQWRATAIVDGRRVESPVVTVPWLVGPDDAVGLPEGTTPSNPITKPVDGAPAPSEPAPSPSEPAPSPSETSGPQHPYADNFTKSIRWCTPIERGHLDLDTSRRGDALWLRLLREAAPTPTTVPLHAGILEVSDEARQAMPSGRVVEELRDVVGNVSHVWELPESQEDSLPWLGFNTERLDFSNVERLTYRISDAIAPEGGAWAIGGYDPIVGKITLDVDSLRHAEQALDLSRPMHMHRSLYFSKPGFYQLTFRVDVTPKDPSAMEEWQRTASLRVNFAVSDEAAAFACERNGETLPKSTPSESAPAPSESMPEPSESAPEPSESESVPSVRPSESMPEPSESAPVPSESMPAPSESSGAAPGPTPTAPAPWPQPTRMQPTGEPQSPRPGLPSTGR